MNTRNKIDLTLKVFKSGYITIEEATDNIMKFIGDSKRFQYFSFVLGTIVGTILMYIKNYLK